MQPSAGGNRLDVYAQRAKGEQIALLQCRCEEEKKLLKMEGKRLLLVHLSKGEERSRHTVRIVPTIG